MSQDKDWRVQEILAKAFDRLCADTGYEDALPIIDVVPVLNELKNHYTLGLLTNSAPDLQRRKLAGAGLADYFYEVVISGEVGFEKPDTRIFELILERLNSTADLSVMIGNSLKSDIAPAIEIGMLAVWVNRNNKTVEGTIKPKLAIWCRRRPEA